MNDYYKSCKFPKPQIKAHKRKKVSKVTYNIVYLACGGRCVLCGARDIQAHHILYRSESPELIDDPKNLIMLCTKHHIEVHSNKDYWQDKLLELAKEIYI